MGKVELLIWAAFYGGVSGGLLVLVDRLRRGRLHRLADSVHADASGTSVHLSGETGGLRGVLLRATGVSGQDSVQVRGDGLRARKAAYGGNAFVGIPLAAITAVRSGQGRPVWLLCVAAYLIWDLTSGSWFTVKAWLLRSRGIDTQWVEWVYDFADLPVLPVYGVAMLLVVSLGYFWGATADLTVETAGRKVLRLQLRAGSRAERVANLAAVNRAAEAIDHLLSDVRADAGWSLPAEDEMLVGDGELSDAEAEVDPRAEESDEDPSEAKESAESPQRAEESVEDPQRAHDPPEDHSGAVDLPPEGGDPFARQADLYANQLYRTAKQHARSGDRRTAVRILRAIVKEHAATPAAEKARRTLDRGQTGA